jgi:DNA polymerase-3 subunit epsilon
MPNQSRIAAQWLERDPLFLDTETTGLDHRAEVCDLAVVDAGGQVLLNTLIRTRRPIPLEAYAIHGISNREVQAAPPFEAVTEQLRALLSGRLVVVYNADFDAQMLRQSHASAQAARYLRQVEFVCAMKLYAVHYGEWNSYRRSYRWQKLEDAARQCRLAWAGDAHRALADAEMCRRVVRHLAGAS